MNDRNQTPKTTPCESCAYYDVIDEDGTMGCVVDIDQDELERERSDRGSVCHYYQFYDEYKTVQKQI